MRRLTIAALAGLALALASPTAAAAQARPAPAPLPEVRVTGPTVVAFWLVPASDTVLEADPDLASALDQQQTSWADSRAPLAGAGITAAEQPGRRFCVREPERSWCFSASPDSAAIGYLLVRPGQPPRVLYRVWQPDELLAEARAFFRGDGGPR